MFTYRPNALTVAAGLILGLGLTACSGGPSGSLPQTSMSAQARSAGGSTLTTASLTKIPLHIPTWAFDEYRGQGAYTPASVVQQYLSYAEGGQGNDKAVSDCTANGVHACSSVFYMDPNFVYASTTCPSSQESTLTSAVGYDESWYVHEAGYTDLLHRLHGSYSQTCNGSTQTIPVYLLNDGNPAVQGFFQSYMRSIGDAWDAYWMDDTSTRLLTQGYGPGGGFCQDAPNHYCTTTQELPTDASLAAAHGAFASAMTHSNGMPMKYFFNGVGFSGTTPKNLDLFQASSNFVGAVCEDCIVSAGQLRPTMYAKVLNAMAAVDQIPGAQFVELNTGFDAAGSFNQLAQRRITTAIAWLGFADGQTVVFPDLEDNTTNLAAWPEESIYPTQPVQTMTSGAADLQVAPGVYRREFASCYYAGVAIGQCAAVVNSNSTNAVIQASYLSQTYRHVVYISGGDVANGGSVSFTYAYFVPGTTQLLPGQGTLLVK